MVQVRLVCATQAVKKCLGKVKLHTSPHGGYVAQVRYRVLVSLCEKPYDVVCGHVSAAISVRENWGCFLSFRNAKLHCSLFLSLGTGLGAPLSG